MRERLARERVGLDASLGWKINEPKRLKYLS